jgi:polar amino acid transport system permease protein
MNGGNRALAAVLTLTDEQLAAAKLRPRRSTWTWVAATVAAIIVAQIIYSMISNPAFGWSVVGRYLFSPQVLTGLSTTLMLTAVSMPAAVLIGIIVAVAADSKNCVLSSIAKAFVWIFRGIPLLVQIIFWYNLAALYPKISLGVPFVRPFFQLNTNEVITALGAAFLALVLNEAAYMSEIVRSGLNSIDHGQREAARVLGMSSWKAFRRVILPQAMRVIIPPTGNETISMLKFTSLVSVVALPELLYSTQLISSQNFEVIPMLLVATIWYVILTTILTAVQSRIERRFSRSVINR